MATRDAIADPWGSRTPYERGRSWPSRVDSYLEPGVAADDVDWVQSASVLHSNGDALDIGVHNGRMVGVRGREVDRVNRGRLDPKDLFAWQATQSADRLTDPLVRDGDRLVTSDWSSTMDLLASKARSLLETDGPGAIGFYTSGQLFLEEYYTLAAVARGGLGTNHVDGNTRLCTATAAAALKESFGCDGQPGSYTDIDHADVIALFGHNVAETQSVLFARILDRLAGPNPPALVCVDPRRTPVAREATVHLAPLPGTNVALMNGLLHEIIRYGWLDETYIRAHTVGFDDLAQTVEHYPPEVVEAICDVPAAQVQRAAEIIGTAGRLTSTVLQGFYQSHQATAASVQVNNVHLIRGMIGRPGAGVLQMNGQPTAQNTRETGADGDITGFRNWANPGHMAELAGIWNVPVDRIRHDKPPTHVMQVLELAERGELKMLWISGTNPAASLPELHRIRDLLSRDDLFVIVQDIFPTETTELADVVLPAAGWGEKTGTFTNADRTVHISERAVDPPGRSRSDLQIWLDFARRMDLRDVDGQPFPPWTDENSAFEAWQRASAGRPCDYSGLTYDKLRGGSGIQWPCTTDRPHGTERLYEDGEFRATPTDAEDFGKDLLTGDPVSAEQYRQRNPDGKAMIKSAPYVEPPEDVDADYPMHLNTGRTLYHFHTRTKTGRTAQLEDAAPDVWVEISGQDAERCDIAEGDLVQVQTRRGAVRAKARIAGIRPGVLFLPFHYGYWDRDGDDHDRAANELTITTWDPVSKQPLFKSGAARLTKLAAGDGRQAPAPPQTGAEPSDLTLAPHVGGRDAAVTEAGADEAFADGAHR